MKADNKNRHLNENHLKRIKDIRERKIQDVIERKYLKDTDQLI